MRSVNSRILAGSHERASAEKLTYGDIPSVDTVENLLTEGALALAVCS